VRARSRPLPPGPDAGAWSGRRLTALDGLRGVAALVVVVHHSVLTWPSLAAQYQGQNRALSSWWLTFTPLHLVWAGTQAVIVFFVLSGIVLAKPYLDRRSATGTWPGYYARRLVRLYVPVAAALLVAGVLVRLFPRTPAPGVSWWYAAHAVHVTPGLLAHDALLLDGVSWVDDVLWSLRYEVTFSLVLPLVVLAARWWPKRLWLNLPIALALVVVGQRSANPFAQWMPYFVVGVALASGWSDLQGLAARIERLRLRAVVWTALSGAAGMALLCDWWFQLLPSTDPWKYPVAMGLVAFGAALLCFLVQGCPWVRAVSSGRLLQWAGRISFSLYLVHEPIVVSVSSLVGPGKRGVAVTLFLGGAIAIAVAMLFHRLVERPSQRWARVFGDRIDGRLRRPAAVQAPPSAVLPRHTASARRLTLPPVPPPRGDRPGRDRLHPVVPR
jgi:peptidoglycan/LPS O-acetylase OafA/YrhL